MHVNCHQRPQRHPVHLAQFAAHQLYDVVDVTAADLQVIAKSIFFFDCLQNTNFPCICLY